MHSQRLLDQTNFDLLSDDPAEFLAFFLNDDILDLIVTETNRYADQSIHLLRTQGLLKKDSRIRKWRLITQEEMKAFIALLFLMGIHKKPDVHPILLVH